MLLLGLAITNCGIQAMIVMMIYFDLFPPSFYIYNTNISKLYPFLYICHTFILKNLFLDLQNVHHLVKYRGVRRCGVMLPSSAIVNNVVLDVTNHRRRKLFWSCPRRCEVYNVLSSLPGNVFNPWLRSRKQVVMSAAALWHHYDCYITTHSQSGSAFHYLGILVKKKKPKLD